MHYCPRKVAKENAGEHVDYVAASQHKHQVKVKNERYKAKELK